MAYYRPLKRELTDNRWYYTCTDGAGIYTMPCCEACGGHDTSSEAINCNRIYNVERAKDAVNEDEQHKCSICSAWTQKYYIFDPSHFRDEIYLCEEHFNKNFLDQATKPKEEPKKEKIKKDWSSVPKDLKEAMTYLDESLPEDVKEEFKNYKDDPQNLIVGDVKLEDHFACYIIASMGLRNSWGLWSDSPIAHWFRKRGVWMGDDLSAVISTAYYHHIHGYEVDEDWVENERKYYDSYWKASGAEIPTYEDWVKGLENEAN